MRALRGDKRVRALSDVAGTLPAGAPALPDLRAAAFRMLAGLPGVKTEGRATDPLGRAGTVVSLPVETTVPLGLYTAPKQLGTRRQWIIDPDRGRGVDRLVAELTSPGRRPGLHPTVLAFGGTIQSVVAGAVLGALPLLHRERGVHGGLHRSHRVGTGRTALVQWIARPFGLLSRAVPAATSPVTAWRISDAPCVRAR
ncbi:hypothetical protein [Actinomadura sp. HBU206391]|uniref:hypothetical protein n=1 Tax=Actinomadura sp. HBU206391 TaxID=2731692 RepID=UPI00165057ED|nr:hypothetical protein [Actinomadura sp. HBU206391]MBC6456642.1 hypothetical protein [Actinomadura sp. HBU206391]